MSPEEEFELGLQALLDGRELPANDAGGASLLNEPMREFDAIARAHRSALFGLEFVAEPELRTRWGHLELRDTIGRGASGTVYRAWDTQLERAVALKLLPIDADPRQALEEGRLLARLNHPHIVRVLGADTHDGQPGIWMELLDGETLDDLLVRDGRFSAVETLFVGLDLARALAAVHAAGLVHRDVKTRNIVRERGGRIVLTDFGAGRSVAVPAHDGAGTPMFMAPEILAGGGASERSDIYSLGVVLYRLLTTRFPVRASDVNELRAAHAARRRDPLATLRPDLTPEVVAVVERSCHPDLERRFASALDCEAALTEALGMAVGQPTSVASPWVRRWSRWRRLALGSAAATVAALLVVGYTWQTNRGRDARRALGMAVPPRSPLYLALNGSLAIVRGRDVALFPNNPTTATGIAVSSDYGVRTTSGIPPWMAGTSFRLDGTPVATTSYVGERLCCFLDGTTDGRFNYTARTDSTLLEPIGSRRLDPPALYRFDREWSNPRLLFLLAPDGTYFGVAYSGPRDSFWLVRRFPNGSAIEEWSRDGKLLATPVNLPAVLLTALAIDPQDGTLWAVRANNESGVVARLENYDDTGRHLGWIDLLWPLQFFPSGGAEFEWRSTR